MKKSVKILSLLLTAALMVSLTVPSFLTVGAESETLKKGSYYKLVNKATGTYLTETDDNTFDPPYDTRITVLDAEHETDTQIWELVDQKAYGTDVVNIVGYMSGKSLHKTARADTRVSAASYYVITSAGNTNPQQRWKLIDAGDGYYRIQNSLFTVEYLASTALESEKIPGKLDITAAPLNENDDAQLWRFVKVPDPPIDYIDVDPIPGYPLDPAQPVTPQFSNQLSRVQPGDVKIDGYVGNAVDYIAEEQAKGTNWKFLVDQFRYKTDFIGNTWQNWRGEFWGKVMRGASWHYQYSQDEELYAMLERTVMDLLSTQEANGRISSFPLAEEILTNGNNTFDLWNRKYVMVGLQSFYDICKDEQMKAYILKGLCISADYILSKVGPGKISILDPIDTLGGLSTSSILDPMINLYKMTGYQRYLDFCEYIIGTGGSKYGNVFEAAYKDELSPYQYTQGFGHAYAFTSCMEGLAEYAMITGSEKWLQAVKNYASRVIKDEITILGSGSIGEHWKNTVASQDDPDTRDLQETCITITWIKMCEKLLRITGDPLYADQIEKTTYNALLGAMQGPDAQVDDACASLHWDYFSFYNGTRHHEFGGHIVGVDSCCSASGISGTGILPFVQVMNSASGPVVNLYNPGTMKADTPSGNKVELKLNTQYPAQGNIEIVVTPEMEEQFAIKLRIPGWSEKTTVKVNGTSVNNVIPGTYLELSRTWKAGDNIEIIMDMRTKMTDSPKGQGSETEGYVALVRGPITLARDVRFNDGSIYDGSNIKKDVDGYAEVTLADTQTFDNHMEFIVNKTNGSSFRVTDYASAGSTWTEESRYAIWMTKVAPMTLKENTEYFLYCKSDNYFATADESNGNVYRNANLLSDGLMQTWILEKSGNSYNIKNVGTGKYLTTAGDANGAAVFVGSGIGGNALWNIKNKSPDTFTLASANGGRLMSGSGSGNAIHLWENGNSNLQIWLFAEKNQGEPEINKEALESAIAAASQYDGSQNDYSTASWGVFTAALEEANAIRIDDTATQDDVNRAAEALEDSIAALKPLIISVVAPTSVYKCETFSVTVTTDPEVTALQLCNEANTKMGVTVTPKPMADGNKVWDVAFNIGTLGTARTFTLAAKNASGSFVATNHSFSLDVVTAPVTEPVNLIWSAGFACETYTVNETMTLTVTTGPSVNKVSVYNENGGKIGISGTAKKDAGGVRTWTLTLAAGTKGGRIFTVSGIDSSGQATNVVTANVMLIPVPVR